MIELPNGANVEEIVLPNGRKATQVIAPDGSVVWSDVAIPDSTVLHIDATQEDLIDDDSTSLITDFSGEGNDLTGDSVTYKTDVQEGNAVFRFDGTEILNNSDPVLDPPYTITVAVNNTDDGNDQSVFSSEADSGDNRSSLANRFESGNINLRLGDNAVSDGDAIADWTLFTVIATDDTGIVRKNGSQIMSRSFDSGHQWGGAQVGTRYADDWSLNGDLGELLQYSDNLNDNDELEEEEQRIADKWGIPLD